MNKHFFVCFAVLFSDDKEISRHENTWRKLKCIWLSAKSRSENNAYSIIPIVYSGKGKEMEKVKRTMVSRASGKGKRKG